MTPKDEAKKILHSLLKVPDGYENEAINRLVDCIVMSLILKTAAWQAQAMKNGDDA